MNNSLETPVNIFWFRRDLRLSDNAGLSAALQSGNPVLLLFVFDENILIKLENKMDRRVEFIYLALVKMQEAVTAYNSSIDIRYGKPLDIFRQLVTEFKIEKSDSFF